MSFSAACDATISGEDSQPDEQQARQVLGEWGTYELDGGEGLREVLHGEENVTLADVSLDYEVSTVVS